MPPTFREIWESWLEVSLSEPANNEIEERRHAFYAGGIAMDEHLPRRRRYAGIDRLHQKPAARAGEAHAEPAGKLEGDFMRNVTREELEE